VLLACAASLTGLAAVFAPLALAATGLTATLQITDDWGTGYAGTYTIRNGGTTSVTGWKLEFDLPADTTVRKFWTANMARSGTHWVFTNQSYNGTIPAGGSQAFGFNTVGAGRPSNCLVNGAPCAGGTPSPSPSKTTSPSPSPSPSPTPSTPPPPATSPYTRVAVSAASASTNGAVARDTIDGRLDTAWSASGDGQWLTLDLGTALTVGVVKVAFQNGGTRQYLFDIQVSNDNTTWTKVWSGRSGGTGTGLETFDVTDGSARYVRYLGHGNSVDLSNALTEVEVEVVAAQSQHVRLGTDGKLTYPAYPNGDTIPDFSRAGYGGGGVALPTVPVRKTISPVDGDDGASIQAAIDEVSLLTPDGNQIRGAVLLTKGTYDVVGSITIKATGVVLRGEGDGPTGTVIRATGTSARVLINVAGVSNRSEVAGSRQTITSSYVPVGARTFTVADGSGFHVGDDVVVVRTPNQEWIDAVGTDSCTTVGTSYDTADVTGATCLDNPWTPAERQMSYERRITAVSGNQLTIDSPLVEAFQAEFGGGAVYKYQFPGRVQKAAVENLRAESDFVSDTDEAHATHMIALRNVENAWVRNVTSVYFVQGTMLVAGGSRYVTVQDSASLDHKSIITGGRRYPFQIDDASHVLIMRNYTQTARHDYVTGSNTPGPNVFLDNRAEQSYSEVGPHHRWATGVLFDNVVHRSSGGGQILGVYNRGNQGTGHGWSGAYVLFYNCLGDTHQVASPPYARNWSIGTRATRQSGTGEFDSYGKPVGPWSLYLQQLRDRLGDVALTNIGY
jgi:hypothetical protein